MFWRFDLYDTLGTQPLPSQHAPGLVVLAIGLATLAALTLLPVIERYRRASTAEVRLWWLLSGALAMGCGVWAMHFTAMLAHQLPVPVAYSPGISLISILPIIVGAAGMIYSTGLPWSRSARVWIAALSLGLGMGTMHYTGMEAMRSSVAIHYHPLWFVASILVAVLVAWLGIASNLFLLRRLRRIQAYLVGALLLGLAVTAMHYVAMLATEFHALPEQVAVGGGLDYRSLSILVSVAVVVIVGLLFTAVAVDRRLSDVHVSLSDSEVRFELLAETSENGIFTSDGVFDYINPAMTRITGYSAGELYQMPVETLLGFEPSAVLEPREGRRSVCQETFVTTKNGGYRWLYVTLGCAPLGGEIRYLGTVFDITERKRMEQELRYLAFNDPLTDLPNRKFFINRLNALLGESRAVGEKQSPSPEEDRATLNFALMFLDINRFKSINDNFGLSKGDSLLQMMARRIKAALPNADLIARVGGDEFAVLFVGDNQLRDVDKVAERLHEAFDHPFRLAEQEFYLTLSVGIAYRSEQDRDAEQVYRGATIAKESAKQSAQAHATGVFDAAMRIEARGQTHLENELRLALREQEFELFYQPIVTLPEGELLGFEALIRWRRSDGALIFPGDFITAAEKTGLINPLGDWVFQEACRQIQAWNQVAGPDRDFYISVNLSSIQFFQTGLLQTVREAMTSCAVRPGQIKLELTESILIDDNPQVMERMRQLMAMGCDIMVDDFGTGYSSLSYLQRFPLSTLKIDQSFVARIESSTGLHLVKAIIAMARALELGVIAEGIESEAIGRRLAELGCLSGQGYHYDRPLPAPAASERLARAIGKS